MSIKWREMIQGALIGLRDFALTVFIVGAMQVLLGLIVWPILFRSHPLGLSMALSLVGFASWLLSFIFSLGERRRRRFDGGIDLVPPEGLRGPQILDGLQSQLQRSGCGFILLVGSLLPLGIAFVLRLRADLQAGMDIRDIFPPMP
ncbi:MAG: hypothetical protein JXA09_17440 [Anaerolineae bacterium]|nr:hypothetical protein [Anaerolineae bacterium]